MDIGKFYYFSGGSTGKPKVMTFTNDEWLQLAEYRMNCYKSIGIKKNDRVAILLPFGPWIAGPSVQASLHQLGCKYFPIGQLEEEELYGFFNIVKEYDINILITAPSFLEFIIKIYNKSKRTDIKFDTIITSGEFLSKELRNLSNKYFSSKTFSSYASSEFFIGIECKDNINCFHYNPSFLKIEVNNSSDELIFTSNIVKRFKKYSLGDKGYIQNELCSCGIDLPKVCLVGRKKGVFCLAGAVNVYPYQIYEALSKIELTISKCEVYLTSKELGIDNILFRIYTNDNKTMPNNKIIEKLSKLSLDFNDIFNRKFISLDVEIIHTTKKSSKLKLVVTDKRKLKR